MTRSVEMRQKSHWEIFRERPKTELKLISARIVFIAENETSKSLLSCVRVSAKILCLRPCK